MTAARDRAELVVLGGGPGGYVTAIRAAQFGMDAVVVEASHLGGVCLNEGCVPSKAMIHDAGEVRGDTRLGLLDDAGVAERFRASRDHRTNVIGRLRQGVAGLLRSNGVEVIRGRGELDEVDCLTVTDGRDERQLYFDHLVVATGSEPVVPPGYDVDGTSVLTAREVFELESLPARVVVVGGGYIGLELAGALADFGSSVVVVEALDRVLAGIEPVLAAHVEAQMRRRGIDIRLDSRVAAIGDDTVEVEGPDGSMRIDTDAVVVAVGRRPRTSGIGLDRVGIALDEGGFIPVDDELRTAVPHIRAIGDVTRGPALAHRAMAQGRVAAASIAGRPERYGPAAVPAVVFTTPEVATVGLGLSEARERGFDADEARFPLSASARGLLVGADGFGLMVHDRDSGLVLGVHLVGPSSGELIGTAALALEMGAVIDDVAATVFPHPTVSEVFGELAEWAEGLPTHVARSASEGRRRAGAR